MAVVDVTVAGKTYQLACENGQEPHLRRLAGMVDAEARALAAQLGPTGEGRLLLMTALLMADRLAETRADAAQGGGAAPDPQGLDDAVARLEAVVEAHENRA